MTEENFSQWGIVELMGRKVVAGLIQKSVLFGPPLLRVDIPATSDYPESSQFYGETAIYCVTPTSEEVARRAAESYKVNPVSVYVPDLITREQYDELKDKASQLQNEIYSLKRLPEPQEED